MENTRRVIQNIPGYMYSKVTGKPFHRTMKVANEKNRTYSLQRKVRNLKNQKTVCLSIRNKLPDIYIKWGCHKYLNRHANITKKNVKNLKRVNVNALVRELVPGNVNQASIRNLPTHNLKNIGLNIPTSMYFPPLPARGGQYRMTRKH